MKILIVDDHPEYKCKEILQECEKRKIEVIVEKAINPALYEIINSDSNFDGIILDMGLPIYKDEIYINESGGDRILRELKRRGYNIPILIFSETESEWKDKCDFVFEQMVRWNVALEEEKFYAFLEKIAKEN